MNSKKIALSIFSAFLLVGVLSTSTATASYSGFSNKDKKQFVTACVDGVKSSLPTLSAAPAKNYCTCAWTVVKKNFTKKQIQKGKKSTLTRLQTLTAKNCADKLVQ